MKKIDLNCDLGEGAGQDAQIMPYISSANIACGYHAGDEETMKQTIELCKKHKVLIGAHPSFPDRENFGRTDMQLPHSEIYDLIIQQVNLLKSLAENAGVRLNHVKPHGALYNMAARDKKLASIISLAVKDCGPELILFGLSGSHLVREGKKIGLKVLNEVFADRTYTDQGKLTSRQNPDALINSEQLAIAQVLQMVNKQTVSSVNGKEIPMIAETICIHGDGEQAVAFAREIHSALKKENVIIGFN